MKRLLVLMLMTFILLCVVGCSADNKEETAPAPSTEETEVIEETKVPLNAETFLRGMIGSHLGDDDFVKVCMEYIPNIEDIRDYHCACWTYFLVMEDGSEYVIFTDYDGKITSISEWFCDDGTCGETLYNTGGTYEE